MISTPHQREICRFTGRLVRVGFLFIVCDVSNRQEITAALTRNGAKFVNFDYDLGGMVSWRTSC